MFQGTDDESKGKISVTVTATPLKGPLHLLPGPGVFLVVNCQVGAIKKSGPTEQYHSLSSHLL